MENVRQSEYCGLYAIGGFIFAILAFIILSYPVWPECLLVGCGLAAILAIRFIFRKVRNYFAKIK